MQERSRTWLGWPVWLVVALITIAAVTGTGAPVGVLFVLGSLGLAAMFVEASIAGWVQRRWRQDADARPRPGPDAGDEPGAAAAGSAAPRAPVPSPDRGAPPGGDAQPPDGT